MKKGFFPTLGLVALVASLLQINLLLSGLGLSNLFTRVQAETPNQKVVAVGSEHNYLPTTLKIAKINLELPVVLSPRLGNSWEVKKNVANFAEGTSLVNINSGNVGLFGHDTVNVFRNIKNLSAGDLITVSGNSFTATYEVYNQVVVNPEQVSVFDPTTTPELTLITCDGVFSQKRFMVKASLKELK